MDETVTAFRSSDGLVHMVAGNGGPGGYFSFAGPTFVVSTSTSTTLLSNLRLNLPLSLTAV